MSLKDKLTQIVTGPRREEPSAHPDPASAPPPAPPLPEAPPPATRLRDFDDDSDRTIYEPDPATLEQIRNLTAGWNPSGAPATTPTPQPAPTTPSEMPRAAGRTSWAEGINAEDIRVDLNNFSPLRADGSIDFTAVYSRAGLRAPAFGAEQVLQMISELPPEMPEEMKRQTAQVMVNTMGRHLGATSDAIAEDATRKVAALSSFVVEYEKMLKATTAGVEAEIASLQALIEEKKRTLQGTDERLNQIQVQCEGEANRLDDVLSYLNVAPPADRAASRPVNARTDSSDGNSWESAPSVELKQAEEEGDTADTIER